MRTKIILLFTLLGMLMLALPATAARLCLFASQMSPCVIWVFEKNKWEWGLGQFVLILHRNSDSLLGL